MATADKNIVVLGGSYGGISAAHSILKHTLPHLPNKETYHVVMISAASQAMCRPGCPRALISDDLLDQSRFFVDIPQQFEQYPTGNFRFIQGTATELDHQSRTVTYRSRTHEGGQTDVKIPFYALVIATGTSTPSPLFSFNKDEGALRVSWEAFRHALSTASSIVVAGGGPTGVEVAGELGEYLNGRAWFFGSKLENPKVSVTLVTADKKILPILRPSLADKAEGMLTRVGVTVIKNARVKSVSPEGSGSEAAALATKTTVALENGQTLEADIYIPAFGVTYNTSFVAKELLISDKRIDTNPSTLRVDKAGPRIYAVGDVTSAARPAVHNILSQIPVLSANIKRDLLSDAGITGAAVPGEDRVFKEDTKETQLVPIGQSKGVGAFSGFAVPSFLVWLIKGRDYWLWTTGNLWNGKQWSKES